MTIGTGIAVAGVALAVAALGIFAPAHVAFIVTGICAMAAMVVALVRLVARALD